MEAAEVEETDSGPARQDLFPLVVLVGESAKDHRRIDELREAGAVIVIASTPDAIRAWLPGAFLERSEADRVPAVVRVNGLEVDLTEHRAEWRETPLVLRERELQILAALGGNRGQIWTFEELLRRIWETDFFGDIEAVHSAVQRLRRKLKQAGVGLTIEAVRGVGFRLVPETSDSRVSRQRSAEPDPR